MPTLSNLSLTRLPRLACFLAALMPLVGGCTAIPDTVCGSGGGSGIAIVRNSNNVGGQSVNAAPSESSAVIRGSGHLASEARPVAGVSAVELVGSGNVEIEPTGADALVVEAEDNLLPYLKARLETGRLTLGGTRNACLDTTRPVTYRLMV